MKIAARDVSRLWPSGLETSCLVPRPTRSLASSSRVCFLLLGVFAILDDDVGDIVGDSGVEIVLYCIVFAARAEP